MRTLAILSVLLACPATSGAAEHAVLRLVLQQHSRIWLEGDSTLHPYKSAAEEILFTAEIAWDGTTNWSEEAVLSRMLESGELKGLEMAIPVLSLKSGKRRLDKNMYKSLKAKQAPEIKFTLMSYEVRTSTVADALDIRALGRLRIAGEQRLVEIEGRAHFSGDKVRIVGRKELMMTDFGITPPVMFFGALKTDDRVVVYFDLKLEPGNDAARNLKNGTRRKS